MDYSLEDLIDMKQFQDLQDRLNAIYSFPAAIIDNQGRILTATAWQDICTQFHRKNSESERVCIKSDQYISEHLHEANPSVSYRCPHGLVDNALPIIIDGVHYGNFFTGQFFLKEPDMDFFRRQAQKYGFDEKAYLEAVKKVPIWNQEQLDNYLFFIAGLISVISESGLKKLKEIEARKKIEASEKKFKSILKTAMDGYWLTDAEGRLLEVNDAYCQMSGYSEAELLTMNIADLEAHEDAAAVAAHMKKVIRQRTDRFESRHRRKNGTLFDVEVSIQYRPEGNGQSVCFLRDISSRKEAEAVLKESEEKFRNFTEQSFVGFYILQGGYFKYVNPKFADIFGYSVPEILNGVHVSRLVHPDDLATVLENVGKRERGETKSIQYTFRGVRKTGEMIHVAIYGSALIYEHKPAAIGTMLDISKELEMEKRVSQAQRMESIGFLAGGIAHDFNNILFPIVGLSEMLMEDMRPGSAEYENAAEIHRAGRRGSELVKQILAFSRQSEQKKVPVHLHQIIREVMILIRATIPTNIGISEDIPNTGCLVQADPTQIHQIAMNLITNAYHAVAPQSGTISVSLREVRFGDHDAKRHSLQPGQYALLTVADTGCGIDETIMGKIFEPYFTTKEKGKGTGLGLASVYGIVTEHHGEVRVFSEAGQGATFEVYLPIMAQTDTPQMDEEKKLVSYGQERILLVDDEPAIVSLEKQMLERMGYTVTARQNSLEALAEFKRRPHDFDLLITDMTMPDMTGLQLSAEILSIRPDMPIIMCTGFSENIHESALESMGIRGLLMKPVLKSELARTLRTAMDEALENRNR